MYYICKESEKYTYILDDIKDKVYTKHGSYAVDIDTTITAFLKWHPYIDVVSKSETKPKELNDIRKQ